GAPVMALAAVALVDPALGDDLTRAPRRCLLAHAIADQYKNSKYTKQKNKDYKEFAEQLEIADVIKIRGTHSIYLYVPDEIYKLSMEFINKEVEKNEILRDERI
ncbi:hypothetical protein ACWFQB_27445, partial [Peribacillus butanolivorans]